VKSDCVAIIHNPGLLLDSDASHTSGCLFGEAWEQPEAFYAVHALMLDLPHIRGALIAFFTGALATWEHFTLELQQMVLSHLQLPQSVLEHGCLQPMMQMRVHLENTGCKMQVAKLDIGTIQFMQNVCQEQHWCIHYSGI